MWYLLMWLKMQQKDLSGHFGQACMKVVLFPLSCEPKFELFELGLDTCQAVLGVRDHTRAPFDPSTGLSFQADLVSPEEHGSEEASVNRGLVHHHTIFLVVPAVACYGHDCIVTSRQLPESRVRTICKNRQRQVI